MTSQVKRSPPATASAILAIGGLVLFGSLFLTWSHQFSPSLLARYGGSPALRGIPHDPTAWQVYSTVDVLIALLAAALVVLSRFGGRTARLALAACVLVAVAFVVHALQTPPTNGANIYDPFAHPPAYVPNAPSPGAGEAVALAGLALGLGGIALSRL